VLHFGCLNQHSPICCGDMLCKYYDTWYPLWLVSPPCLICLMISLPYLQIKWYTQTNSWTFQEPSQFAILCRCHHFWSGRGKWSKSPDQKRNFLAKFQWKNHQHLTLAAEFWSFAMEKSWFQDIPSPFWRVLRLHLGTWLYVRFMLVLYVLCVDWLVTFERPNHGGLAEFQGMWLTAGG